jgi:SAM-dependent methyltransferase
MREVDPSAAQPAGDGHGREIDWNQFPVEAISRLTYLKRNLIHWDLLREAYRRSSGGVLEVGVGSGAQSALLSRLVAPVVTLDNNTSILQRARSNLARFGRGVHPAAADAFRLPFPARAFGVGISQGLMEHFSDEEITKLVREQLRACRSVVFSVPSAHYPRQDMGNERLMTPAEWRELLAPAVDEARYAVTARHYRGDLEALKYSALARRWLGSFSVLVTIDPREETA